MKAEDAYKLAEAAGGIDDILPKIVTAATLGKTEVKVPMMNDFQVKKLTDLGYMILPDHGDDVFAIVGNRRCDYHTIRWASYVLPKSLT